MKLFQNRVSLVIESMLDPASYLEGRLVDVKKQNNLLFLALRLNKGVTFSAESMVMKWRDIPVFDKALRVKDVALKLTTMYHSMEAGCNMSSFYVFDFSLSISTLHFFVLISMQVEILKMLNVKIGNSRIQVPSLGYYNRKKS